ncbi:hypothetical protein DFJ73DRAFT_934498 [Zopfochytrium polystomum]|nr:hypothetical protein DFJ73DRAFT_934498 [Zopfochytrium polystomum]
MRLETLREGHHVSWFRADSPDNLRADAVQYAVFAGLPDPEKLSPANLFAQIASLHAADGAQPRLIVLDNVERYADVEDVIASHAERGVTAVRFLATTRRALREGGAVAPLLAISLDFPDDEKCAAYLRRLPGRTVLPEDAVRIVRQCGNLPLRVSVAARYLVKRPDVTVDAYLSLVEGAKLRRADGGGDAADEIYPDISLSIDTLAKESSPGHVLLMLMALLHPDNIILSIVAEWCDSFR